MRNRILLLGVLTASLAAGALNLRAQAGRPVQGPAAAAESVPERNVAGGPR